ncbi:hypothetical protein ZIOFF_037652 [Zingiber officinale]|uniref:protein-serine/threonine phosphatase n=1 Tax=Zingiber officinale TaxID=94328 RepID=A0A8J5GKQ9_ZINOF|nr:hypothetical protein ZIOFF_037652 [Zingiber officinale]
MGCVHGKCFGRFKKFFCFSCSFDCLCCVSCSHCQASCTAAAGDDSFGDNEIVPSQLRGRCGLSHVLTGASLSAADVPSAGLRLHFSTLTQRGYYPDEPDRTNEDSFCVKLRLQGDPDLHLFGVFDGHGKFGAQCSEFVRDKLPDFLAADARLPENPVEAFNSAFAATNRALRESAIDDRNSGTTAIAVLVRGDTLFVANVGDSRAVSGVRKDERVVAEDLSSDQTPFRRDECERVKRCGARVLTIDQIDGVKDPNVECWDEKDPDPPRVWVQDGKYPGTAFTRSVGDATAESVGVVAVPEVKEVNITDDHAFFVIASDGVFEFLSSQAVVDMVSSFVDLRNACSAVAAESYKLWLKKDYRTDDITIIVVQIEDLSEISFPCIPRKGNVDSLLLSDMIALECHDCHIRRVTAIKKYKRRRRLGRIMAAISMAACIARLEAIGVVEPASCFLPLKRKMKSGLNTICPAASADGPRVGPSPSLGAGG